MQSREADFPIEGMTCAACAASVEQVLNRLPGVKAQVNLAAEQAHLSYDPQQVRPVQWLDSVRRAGFDVPRRQLVLGVEGMTCSACSGAVEKALQQLPEVKASVNLAAGQVSIDYQPALVSEAELEEGIRRSGYIPFQQVRLKGRALEASEAAEIKAWRRSRMQAVVASLLALPLLLPMLLMWIPGGMPGWLHDGLSRGWQLALATPIQCWAGAGFYRAAWRAVRGRHANMDVLVVLGTSAAYFYSLVLTLGRWPGEVYFDSSAVIISLILWGRLMEGRARHLTTAAVRALMQLQPETARVERDGEVIELDVGRIVVGDIVQVPAGEQVPVDGRVIAGESSIDESMLSGEAMPVAKSAGAMVHAASVNGSGWLRIEVTEVGGDTLLARMIQRVEQAQGSKAPVQRLADRVAAVFVPAVLGLALLTLVITGIWSGHFSVAMVHAVAVLVIACPCSLGLATPTAIMVGAGVAARTLITIRDAEVLERPGTVKLIVFDKTAPFTTSPPPVRPVMVAPGRPRDPVLRCAASRERGAADPLARAARSCPRPATRAGSSGWQRWTLRAGRCGARWTSTARPGPPHRPPDAGLGRTGAHSPATPSLRMPGRPPSGHGRGPVLPGGLFFVVATPQHDAGVVAQPAHVIARLGHHVGTERGVVARLHAAAEHEVLPDQQAQLVGDVEECIILVIAAAPVAQHVHVGIARGGQ